MKTGFQQSMQEAMRRTAAGDLAGATATIQAALSGASGPMPVHGAAPGRAMEATDVDVINVPAREVEEAAPAVQAGAFIDGQFEARTGGRIYKLYIPPAAAAGAPLPLVVMLHGCTQNAVDFAEGTAMNELAKAQGFYVLYPEQAKQANPQRCWNWFKHSHQERGRGEPALIAGMTRAVMAQHAIDADRVYVAGLSAGGAMAAILAQAYPDLFAAAGVHSGLAAGAARDLPSALSAMKSGTAARGAAPRGAPTIVFHGSSDTTVHPSNGEDVLAAAAGAAASIEREEGTAAGGRRYRREVHSVDGRVRAEHWVVEGAPHAWSGGTSRGSYTDPRGPDASAEMLRFFLAHPRSSLQ